jgi:hypothetical protein
MDLLLFNNDGIIDGRRIISTHHRKEDWKLVANLEQQMLAAVASSP